MSDAQELAVREKQELAKPGGLLEKSARCHPLGKFPTHVASIAGRRDGRYRDFSCDFTHLANPDRPEDSILRAPSIGN